MMVSISGRSMVLAVGGNTVLSCRAGIVWMTVERRRPAGPSADIVMCPGQRQLVAGPARIHLTALGASSSAEVCATFAASSQIQLATRLTSSRGVSSAGISQYELGLGTGRPASGSTTS